MATWDEAPDLPLDVLVFPLRHQQEVKSNHNQQEWTHWRSSCCHLVVATNRKHSSYKMDRPDSKCLVGLIETTGNRKTRWNIYQRVNMIFNWQIKNSPNSPQYRGLPWCGALFRTTIGSASPGMRLNWCFDQIFVHILNLMRRIYLIRTLCTWHSDLDGCFLTWPGSCWTSPELH